MAVAGAAALALVLEAEAWLSLVPFLVLLPDPKIEFVNFWNRVVFFLADAAAAPV
jgi:hypothetical protein